MKCSLCQGSAVSSIYKAGLTPLFQNKVYPSAKAAVLSPAAEIELLACPDCGFICNGRFNPALMNYDGEYQNEQAHSPTFDRYLDQIADLLETKGFLGKKIIEVGCGKGTFLNKLWSRNFDATGFDTAYEGADPRVHREYFTEKHAHLQPDLIVLRHTLEHIANPHEFLRQLAALLKSPTQIYIEVPAFEWILAKKAFWDVFYEHCNYFTQQSLTSMFTNAQSGLLFGDQYMYVLADLQQLETAARTTLTPRLQQLGLLQDELQRYRSFVQQHAGLLVWGAGAKGSTFVNLTDPDAVHIKALVDINARKAGAYVAGTGHPIIAPELITQTGAREILVMNENYRDEIGKQLAEMNLANIKLYTLGM